CSNGVTSLDVW
nr:immunoglobulin heavy chain junction region [Macaca mulatta]MOX91597.1 immunoglobulin heavy chain junction region [Macaca mulatta]MOX91749.1 immunoglobulin heavy chain junction region [Macaca mulatta]MOX91757.1 immunoglobulin heavy chain junction region [Macaca mulatta]MOX91818.1 immunoglobulin heavy chain junction region [Macaca mulatta]